MSSETNLEKQILATVVYYDILDYPLTGFEIFLYLVETRQCLVSTDTLLSEIINLLDSSEFLKKHLDQKYGFYFLKRTPLSPPLVRGGVNQLSLPEGGEIDIVQQRLNRKKLADWKWKKAGKIFWIAQIIPFMKMVLVSGSLAFGNSKDESDIDVIITAKKGRIWIVRTFATLLTSILGARRHNNITKNRICLNHYITDRSLKIPFESLYNAQSYVHLINVYRDRNDQKLFKEFQKENKWIKKYVENYKSSELENFRGVKRNKILAFAPKILEVILSGKFGNYLEKRLSEIQSKRIKKDPLYKKEGGRITINNDQLEFHPNSREAKIIPEFNKRMEKLGLFEFAKQKDSGLYLGG